MEVVGFKYWCLLLFHSMMGHPSARLLFTKREGRLEVGQSGPVKPGHTQAFLCAAQDLPHFKYPCGTVDLSPSELSFFPKEVGPNTSYFSLRVVSVWQWARRS